MGFWFFENGGFERPKKDSKLFWFINPEHHLNMWRVKRYPGDIRGLDSFCELLIYTAAWAEFVIIPL